MAKLRFSACPVLLLALLQAGCVSAPDRTDELGAIADAPRPTCDTSVDYIYVAARIRNDTHGEIEFNLDGNRGPPYDPWYLGYRVHSGGPGAPYGRVHNSGHDSVWTGAVSIAPGDSADFNVPIFGLRPADYLRYFRIELRDSKGRSYWTPPFELCAVAPVNCGCPRRGASATGPQSCPTTPLAGLANAATQVAVGPTCR